MCYGTRELMDIVKKESVKVIGFEINSTDKYLITELPHGWKRFIEKYKLISTRIDNRFMDIRFEKQNDIYKHLICVEVYEIINIPEGMVGREFPKSEYLCFNFSGHIQNISESFDKMIIWADKNGYTLDDFRIDYGYFEKESFPAEHTLLYRLL
jgi:predicted transcriptional regulator YdeE